MSSGTSRGRTPCSTTCHCHPAWSRMRISAIFAAHGAEWRGAPRYGVKLARPEPCPLAATCNEWRARTPIASRLIHLRDSTPLDKHPSRIRAVQGWSGFLRALRVSVVHCGAVTTETRRSRRKHNEPEHLDTTAGCFSRRTRPGRNKDCRHRIRRQGDVRPHRAIRFIREIRDHAVLGQARGARTRDSRRRRSRARARDRCSHRIAADTKS